MPRSPFKTHLLSLLTLASAAGTPFNEDEYRAGRQTPTFFGSALTNFGLEPFLQALVELAPTEVTLRANREDFARLRFRPRVLADVSKRSLETTLFGETLKLTEIVEVVLHERKAIAGHAVEAVIGTEQAVDDDVIGLE